ncbi:hypothetical protein J5N97_010387 [Dioscorea zingiberensis]|uniref:Uncharacterized protein n=1 Tax=Dioscorea zingiberensis TaxID=325984 RepID=A0A9D5D026_9LILI|nr:hypothetical protein J5N97_010387 [Dioscorea zingiberensis]
MGGGSSSSGEEDGDAGWRAAIDSVAGLDYGISTSKPSSKPQKISVDLAQDDLLEEQNRNRGSGLKLYQIKAQKLLDDILEKSLEIVRDAIPAACENTELNGGIRLFRQAPPGVTLDVYDAHQQNRKRPRIIPGEEVNEKSKQFKRKLRKGSTEKRGRTDRKSEKDKRGEMASFTCQGNAVWNMKMRRMLENRYLLPTVSLAMVTSLGTFTSTIWALHARRCKTVFDAMNSVFCSLITCFLFSSSASWEVTTLWA